MKLCTICGKPITLVPSAEARATKDVTGKPASYFESLFTEHAQCVLDKRTADTSALIKRLAK